MRLIYIRRTNTEYVYMQVISYLPRSQFRQATRLLEMRIASELLLHPIPDLGALPAAGSISQGLPTLAETLIHVFDSSYGNQCIHRG